MKTSTNRYAIFNKTTFAKTGDVKFSRKFTTRDAARTFKQSSDTPSKWGIFDIQRNIAVR